MQFSTVFATLAAVSAVLAAPSNNLVARTGSVEECVNEGKAPKCCADFLDLGGILEIVGLDCLAIPVGGCSTKTACCSGKTQGFGGLINIVVDLDCVQIL